MKDPLNPAWDTDRFYKHDYFYLDRGSGNGDLIYNTCKMILFTKEKSWWSYEALELCADTLRRGKRWPDYLAERITTTNHRQGELSRDPFILFYCLCIFLDRKQFIGATPIPMKLFRPRIWQWRRALQGKPNIFEWWCMRDPANKKKDYVKSLEYFIQWAWRKTR